MPKEIERKFVVKQSLLPELEEGFAINQGYFRSAGHEGATVRIRTVDHIESGHRVAWLTIKGKTVGMSRDEFEYTIPYQDALDLMDKFCDKTIKKVRYELEYENHTWEVDIYEGSDLITAEVELKSEAEEVLVPEWAVKEVTGYPEYYNSNMAK
jgi:adenylate cyclase